MPGGLAESRRTVRRRGGLVALALALALIAVGKAISLVVGGTIGAAIGFATLVMALPTMPVLGMPAAGGAGRLVAALGSSAGLWWLIGQLAAGRATRRPVSGWREWAREYAAVGAGLWIGALGGLLLGALLLGAL